MRIVLSAHFDLARPVMSIKLTDSKLCGLVDNFAGVFVAYQASRKIGVPVYFTNYEELDFDGAIEVAQKLDKETLVIVVDTVKSSDLPAGKQTSIANVYGLDVSELKTKFSEQIHFVDGKWEETEDETWIYGNRFGLKTLYFGVPIPNEYHQIDNSVELANMDKAAELLGGVIAIMDR